MDRGIEEKIYAGVLGKILGVYHGRPVEGWSYERIRDRFGEVDYFVNDVLERPIVLPDDDISRPFDRAYRLPPPEERRRGAGKRQSRAKRSVDSGPDWRGDLHGCLRHGRTR